MSKTTPKFRFDGFSGNWEEKKLSSIVNLIGGYAFKSSDAKKSGVRWLKIANVSNGNIDWSDSSFLPKDFWDKHKNFRLYSGDYVMALTRPIINHNLKIAQLNHSNALLNQRVAKVIFNEDSNFGFQLLRKRDTVDTIDNEITGTDPPNLGTKTLDKIIVSVPSLEEQQKIGTFFKQLDITIALQQQLVEQQQQYKKVMLAKMFPQKGEYVPEIRFVGFSGEWKEAKFGDIYSFKNGLNKEKEAFGTGTPIINYMDVNKNVFVQKKDIQGRVELTDSEKDRFHVQPNDLFFTRTSETSDEIGLTCAYVGEEIDLVFSGFILKATPINNQVDSVFQAYYLRSSSKRKEIVKHSSITTRALTSGTLLSQMSIKVPSLEEQQKIGTFFKQLDETIVLHQKKLKDYQQLKKALLQRMFV